MFQKDSATSGCARKKKKKKNSSHAETTHSSMLKELLNRLFIAPHYSLLAAVLHVCSRRNMSWINVHHQACHDLLLLWQFVPHHQVKQQTYCSTLRDGPLSADSKPQGVTTTHRDKSWFKSNRPGTVTRAELSTCQAIITLLKNYRRDMPLPASGTLHNEQ